MPVGAVLKGRRSGWKARCGTPLIDGHIVVRDTRELWKIFGEKAQVVCQDVRGGMLPSWKSTRAIFTRSLSRALLGLPAITSSASDLYKDTLSAIKSAWTLERIIQPWFTREEAVKQTADQNGDRFVFLPLDKNEGRAMTVCRTLYYQKLLSTYADTKQFQVLEEFPTVKEAQARALEILREHARKFDLLKYWKEGKKTAPPTSFIFPKNKCMEWDNCWKQRVLFSYYRHPLRYYGRLVGRALTLLLREAKALLGSILILSTSCVTRFVNRWNGWFSCEDFATSPGHDAPLSLF